MGSDPTYPFSPEKDLLRRSRNIVQSKTVNHDIGAVTLSAIYHLFPILKKATIWFSYIHPGYVIFYE
jgi:hypothetical protein